MSTDRLLARTVGTDGARRRPGLAARRQVAGVVTGVLGLTALTVALVALRGQLSLASVLLIYLLLVVVVAVVGGMLPGVASAVAGFLLANFFLTTPATRSGSRAGTRSSRSWSSSRWPGS